MLDKTLWEKSINPLLVEHLPAWPCPQCSNGKLILAKGSLCFRQSVKQYDPKEFRKEDFENHVLLGILVILGTAAEKLLKTQARFSAFLTCNACDENVAVCGRAEVPSSFAKKMYKDPSFSADSLSVLIPEYFTPHLLIFPLKEEYPKNIQKELAKSFSSFFSDSSSAGNKLRICIERFLDSQKISQNNNLHQRIVDFKKSNKDLGSMLLAVKWLGNEASHAAEIDKKDFYDYLSKKNISGKDKSYLDYLVGLKSSEIKSTLQDSNSDFGKINFGKQYYVIMGIVSDVSALKWVGAGIILVGTTAAIVLTAGSVAPILIAIGTAGGAGLGGIGGYFAGTMLMGESGNSYLTPTIIEANSADFDKLNCKEIRTLA